MNWWRAWLDSTSTGGVLGCGIRRSQRSLRDLVGPIESDATWLAAVGVQDPENLGGMLRSCAALGVQRVVLGPGTADPLSRRVLRVSMGNALSLELYETSNLIEDLAWLERQHGVRCHVATLSPQAAPLEKVRRDGPVVILVGNERHGVPPEVQAAIERHVRIGMELGTDSLNVSVRDGDYPASLLPPGDLRRAMTPAWIGAPKANLEPEDIHSNPTATSPKLSHGQEVVRRIDDSSADGSVRGAAGKFGAPETGVPVTSGSVADGG